ncbi:MAG TPA: hypothetical protein VHU91_10980 [Mycobacteriales bacterium]|nr:hypothetical protein [Mycobacteriales bacterium]
MASMYPGMGEWWNGASDPQGQARSQQDTSEAGRFHSWLAKLCLGDPQHTPGKILHAKVLKPGFAKMFSETPEDYLKRVNARGPRQKRRRAAAAVRAHRREYRDNPRGLAPAA